MESVIDFIKEFNAHTLIGMALIVWYFTKGIRADLKNDLAAIQTEIKTQAARTDKLYEMFIDLVKEGKK